MRAEAPVAAVDRRWRSVVLEKRGEWVLTALALEGEGLPLVHGFSPDGRGEFASLSETDGALVARRDDAGTRPLYLGEDGSLATDHRFFSEGQATLIPASSELLLGSKKIETARTPRTEVPTDFEEAARTLATLIDHSVEARTAGLSKVAVSFSGGLDSAILAKCASKRAEVLGCSVHSNGSHDERLVAKAADVLGIGLAEVPVRRQDVANELKSLSLPFEPTSMDKALWSIYSSASRTASREGSEVILLGQLADELFGGYRKYETSLLESGPQASARAMAEDVAGCADRGFVRDEQACSRFTEPRFPFAESEVRTFGLSCPVDFKIRNGVRKAILREAATALGVPEEIARAPKKAAQYSSGVLKLLG